MLSLLLAAGAVTAGIAGIAGAWSPCGFSMIDTIGTALGDARRAAMIVATTTFTIGALAGGAITFGGLSLLGGLLGHGATELRDSLAGALALAAAFADWRGWKIAPQIRRQVPERWRWIMPLPLACALYGLLLGLGFTTFVLSFAVWALAGISFAADSAILGVVVGVAFGLGRALPVLWIAPRLGTERGDRCLDRLALEPRLWLGMRRLDAIGLGACAALLGGSSALAAGSAFATDPSADGAAYAWQQLGGTGMLRTATATLPLPGRLPAVGGENVAWLSGGQIVISNGFPSPAPQRIPGPPHATVNALAVSADWLIVRDQSDRRIANLFAVSLRDPARRVYLAGAAIPGAIGRPSIDGSSGRLRLLEYDRERDLRGRPRQRGAERAAGRDDRTCCTRTRLSATGSCSTSNPIAVPSSCCSDRRAAWAWIACCSACPRRCFATRATSPATPTPTTARASARTGSRGEGGRGRSVRPRWGTRWPT